MFEAFIDHQPVPRGYGIMFLQRYPSSLRTSITSVYHHSSMLLLLTQG